MRLKIATFLLMAGTVVGCASNPPPPPPMAMAPEPAPAPAPAPAPMAMDGTYRGMAELASEAPRNCRKMSATQTARVRHNMITLGGMRGRIGADGAITPVGRGGLSGSVTGGTAEVTMMKGRCSYHATLTHA
ncbi:MAG: hypothetical protein NVSMB18_22950 [Acetobacteraceae bacterium]